MYLSNVQSLSLCNMETHALKQVEQFLDYFRDETAFINYFKGRWLPSIGTI